MARDINRVIRLLAENLDANGSIDSVPPGNKDTDESTENYMFFRNLITLRDNIDEMLSMDPQEVDAMISQGHDWVNDHVTAAKTNIEQVHNWLLTEPDNRVENRPLES